MKVRILACRKSFGTKKKIEEDGVGFGLKWFRIPSKWYIHLWLLWEFNELNKVEDSITYSSLIGSPNSNLNYSLL